MSLGCVLRLQGAARRPEAGAREIVLLLKVSAGRVSGGRDRYSISLCARFLWL
jgi:hypothetical protein